MTRRLYGLLRAGVALVLLAFALLTAAQQWLAPDHPWIELSRFLPWFLFAAILLAAATVSLALGRAWVVACIASLAVLAVVTMDLQWRLPSTSAGAGRTLRVMTYNAKVPEAMARRGGLAALGAEVYRLAPDLLVMQDADGLRAPRAEAELAEGPPLYGLPHVAAVGQYVIASRWPLRDCSIGQIGTVQESRRTLHCRIEIDGTLVWVVTAHLITPRAGLYATRHDPIDGVDTWERGLEDRLAQASKLAIAMAKLSGPRIVAGDFNATEASPVMQAVLATGLRDAFAAGGAGWGFTYGHAWKFGLSFLRIDHILVSREFDVLSSEVGRGDASAHRPVVADLVLRAAGR
ncbi:MAG: endonuclease/exonuclease/phosphatase family protein [Aquincola sp.]|nr:endonuclease/exonuclease/phosphatase family protein [Aquincola sp.]MDH4287506.1 endonuclease/exonuclease/phosphatase family protein [Aquincola sp.]